MNETKEYILITSSLLFLQKNYKEVTLQEIVNKTGLSKGAFYHYFENKEKLFLEVLHYFFQSSSHSYDKYSKESFWGFCEDYIQDTIQLNDDLIQKFKKYSDKDIGFQVNFFSMMFDALKIFPNFKEQAILGFNAELKYWEVAIKRGKKNGELKQEISESDFGEIFLYLSDGIGLHMIMRDNSMNETILRIRKQWENLYQNIKI